MATIRPELKYTADHEWVDEGIGTVTIGITTVAAEALGDIVYLDLPEVGSELTAGEACGEVESTKSVSDLFAPVTGTVIEVNQAALDDPSIVNADPFGQGWLLRVEAGEDADLLSAEDYAEISGADIGH
ncbi:MAG TPA: glycine cleavage system protein GcvH [Actinomycetaceae bacterium]|nr:glycine cleavage system protein GcvH [Actinomycetaceae bacterium]